MDLYRNTISMDSSDFQWSERCLPIYNIATSVCRVFYRPLLLLNHLPDLARIPTRTKQNSMQSNLVSILVTQTVSESITPPPSRSLCCSSSPSFYCTNLVFVYKRKSNTSPPYHPWATSVASAAATTTADQLILKSMGVSGWSATKGATEWSL